MVWETSDWEQKQNWGQNWVQIGLEKRWCQWIVLELSKNWARRQPRDTSQMCVEFLSSNSSRRYAQRSLNQNERAQNGIQMKFRWSLKKSFEVWTLPVTNTIKAKQRSRDWIRTSHGICQVFDLFLPLPTKHSLSWTSSWCRLELTSEKMSIGHMLFSHKPR